MKSHRSTRKAVAEKPEKIDWRIVALVTVPLMLFGIGFLVYVTLLNGPKKLTDSDRAMLRDYDGIRAALHRDDLAAARNAGAIFVQTHAAPNSFTEHANALSTATSLDLARSAFSRMSEEATQLVHKNRDYFILGCSMDLCPVKCSPCHMKQYADWVQLQPQIENPYMGQTSPRCGIVKPF